MPWPLNVTSFILRSAPGICIFPVTSMTQKRPSIIDFRVAVPLDSCGGALGFGFIQNLILKVQLPFRLARSLWFSFNFDISANCFISSASFGWPVEADGELSLVAAAVVASGEEDVVVFGWSSGKRVCAGCIALSV